MAMATADQDFQGLISNTSGGMVLMMSCRVTPSGSSAAGGQGSSTGGVRHRCCMHAAVRVGGPVHVCVRAGLC